MFIIIALIFFPWITSVMAAKLIEKAGGDPKKAYIPVLGIIEMSKVVGKSPLWALWVHLPVLNVFMLLSLITDITKAFNQLSFKDTLMATFIPFIYLPKLGKDDSVQYLGENYKDLIPKLGMGREWSDSIIFAVVAASIIRWSTFEAFTIPTPSMEGSLMVGDYLFVSKLHYGPRLPMTPLQVPLTHQTYWWYGEQAISSGEYPKSYVEWSPLPYFRFPGFSEIKRNDVVVFNYPDDQNNEPIDLKTNFIKRCVAIPGDTLQIKNAILEINGQKAYWDKDAEFLYEIHTTKPYSPQSMINFLRKNEVNINQFYRKTYELKDILESSFGDNTQGIDPQYVELLKNLRSNQFFLACLSDDQVKKMSESNSIEKIVKSNSTGPSRTFADARRQPFTGNEFGPLVIPKKGMTIDMTPYNWGLYSKSILQHEGHKEVKPNRDLTAITIDGVESKTYTFQSNYYFMMGDDRDDSDDSRFWGFVPENHIVGKGFFVWFSVDADQEKGGFFERIRFDRMFKLIE